MGNVDNTEIGSLWVVSAVVVIIIGWFVNGWLGSFQPPQ